ncbi:glutathione S-transferase [Chaetomium sp. MPI-CAGE-AT-0009]|nr:glutathione S-transferase [Chaetomium sp. MPI-CAGE-AT-0009]
MTTSHSNLQPIQLWGRRGPNPPKVTMILEELNLPYTHIPIDFKDVKSPEYTAINPNGRLPAIRDPNNSDLILWESGAIIEYLMERYDTDRRLSFAPGTSEAYLTKQWLFFQASGQGPYFGQATWFKMYHHEKVPSAFERYAGEVKRVSAVLESYLGGVKQKQEADGGGDGPWLVGGKLTFADISFVMWYCWMEWSLDEEEFNLGDYPVVKEWLYKMKARESVDKVLRDIKPAHAKK